MTKYIPTFVSIYSSRFVEKFPSNFISYVDPSGGRCEIDCNTTIHNTTLLKQEALKHQPGYIGISKRMAFGQYARTTPGLETVSNKKIPSLQNTILQKQQCFSQNTCTNL